MITALSNNVDHGGRTGMAEYNNNGEYIATHWIPTDADLMGAVKSGKLADGYGYDVRVRADLNIMLTSSFTGWSNYMMDFGTMLQDSAAMQRFGHTMVVWDMHARKPLKVLDVPGTPLEIRCAWDPDHRYCFTSTALTSQIWLIYEDDAGEWQAKAVADIGDPSTIPLPVDISITADDKGLWVDTFMEGKARYFDISDPHAPKQVYEKTIGSQINMVSQSWDGKRVYFSSSLLGNWDKTGDADEQYVKLYHWDGNELKHQWTVDFYKEGLGRSHQMRFGALYGKRPAGETRLAAVVSSPEAPTDRGQTSWKVRKPPWMPGRLLREVARMEQARSFPAGALGVEVAAPVLASRTRFGIGATRPILPGKPARTLLLLLVAAGSEPGGAGP